MIGPYEVLAKLGEGGMGEVYRATDTKLKRQVALKVLPAGFASDPDRLARFDREAHLLATLNHPHIAAIYGVEDSSSVKALVMELVEGPTLAEMLASRGVGNGPTPLDPEEAWRIARQIADALEAAHAQGVIHRDLKPANIKVRDDGTVKVLDFGLAKAIDPAPAASGGSMANSPTMTSPALMSMTGMILGTAAYMAPEQARGRPVDERADIWAFGAILYEMLTGAAAFGGETITDVLAAVVTKDPDFSRVPARFRRLVERCLEKDARRRLRDIGDLELLLSVDSAQAPMPVARASNRLGWGLAGAFAATSLVLAWMYVNRPEPAPPSIVQFEVGSGVKGVQSGIASLSPDGGTLAYYVANPTTAYRVHLRRLDSLEETVIAGVEVPFNSDRPIWSHDGRYLAFGVGTGSFVRLRIPDGKPEQIARFGSRPIGGDWNRDDVVVVGAASGGLRRFQATGGPVTELTTPDKARTDRGDTHPQFLPDQRHLIFTRSSGDSSRSGLWVTALDAPEQAKRLVEASAGAFAGDVPGLGPALVFVRAGRMYAQAIDLTRHVLQGEPRSILPLADGGFTISRNGTLAYGNGTVLRKGRIAWIDRSKGAIGPYIGDENAYTSLDLSPDGTRLATARASDNRAAELWTTDLTRGTELRLSAARDGSGLWSPDASRILLFSYRDGPAALFEAPSNGTGTPRLILKDERDLFTNDWSRDGRFVIYSSLNGPNNGMDLFSVRMEDSPARPAPYLTEPSHQKQAQFSPDGQYVAYISDETGRFEVYVRPFPDPSGGKWPISTGGGVEPRWTRDGKELLYWSGQSLMSVNVTLKPFTAAVPRKLFDAPIQSGYVNDGHRWQVAPDGRRFLVLTYPETQSSPIRVVLNWPGLMEK